MISQYSKSADTTPAALCCPFCGCTQAGVGRQAESLAGHRRESRNLSPAGCRRRTEAAPQRGSQQPACLCSAPQGAPVTRLAEDLPLPFPADEQQISQLRAVLLAGGHMVASPGTEKFEKLNHLVPGGYVEKHHCESALGVYQFSITHKGMEALGA